MLHLDRRARPDCLSLLVTSQDSNPNDDAGTVIATDGVTPLGRFVAGIPAKSAPLDNFAWRSNPTQTRIVTIVAKQAR